MNIGITIDQYNNDYIYLCEPTKNNVMNEGTFIRILYSTPLVIINGVYLYLNLNDTIMEKYYNKYKCIFNVNTHKDLIEGIRNAEEKLLKKANIKYKIPQYKIYEQLRNGHIKIFTDINAKPSNLFILKISGIWETDTSYGVTYKFLKVNHP